MDIKPRKVLITKESPLEENFPSEAIIFWDIFVKKWYNGCINKKIDYYLDKYGRPCGKGSLQSHILPKGKKGKNNMLELKMLTRNFHDQLCDKVEFNDSELNVFISAYEDVSDTILYFQALFNKPQEVHFSLQRKIHKAVNWQKVAWNCGSNINKLKCNILLYYV